ncbi:MAG: undecaprenyl-phosphate glucose phosphotransferase [Pseudomonadota bacterium]
MNEIDPKLKFRTAAKLAAASDNPLPVPEELGEEARRVADLFSNKPYSARMIAGITRLVDFAALIGLGLAAHRVMLGTLVPDPAYAGVIGLGALLCIVVLQAVDAYDIRHMGSIVTQAGRIFIGTAIVFAFLAALALFLGMENDFSRSWFGTWYMSAGIYFLAARLFLSQLIGTWRRDGLLERRAVIVGGGKNAEDLITTLENQPGNDIRICGIFDDRSDDRSPASIAGYPKLGTVGQLVNFAREAHLDLLIVSLPITAESRVLDTLRKLWVLPLDIRLSAHTDKLRFRPRSYSYIGSLPFVDVFEKPLADWDSLIKRVFDIVFASVAIVLLAPLMLATLVAIRLESQGPVLFRQKRYGFNNDRIEVLKFRSMYHHMADPGAKKVVTRNDPRVTRVGRFIRKTSIDELPQLFNVLAGSLSLVGPRPHAVNAHTANKKWEEVVHHYFARHKVKPGVTGWAQINGWRGEVDTPEKIEKRVEHDLYYIENWSVLFDLKILMLTPFKLLNTENAY